MKLALASVVLLCCASTQAGTLYTPSEIGPNSLHARSGLTEFLPYFPPHVYPILAINSTVIAVDMPSKASEAWHATLYVSATVQWWNFQDDHIADAASVILTPPPTGESIVPFMPDGLPADFVVWSVSSDSHWFEATDGRLYRVPEPSALCLMLMGVLCYGVSTARRRLSVPG